jgi:hypothetical protein
MDDAFDALKRARDDVFVADVAADKLDFFRKALGLLAVAVDLLDQAVENTDLVSSLEQFRADGATNESGASGYQHSFCQA